MEVLTRSSKASTDCTVDNFENTQAKSDKYQCKEDRTVYTDFTYVSMFDKKHLLPHQWRWPVLAILSLNRWAHLDRRRLFLLGSRLKHDKLMPWTLQTRMR